MGDRMIDMSDLQPDQIRLGLFFAGLLVFLILEVWRPYRPNTVSKAKRWAINFGLAAFNTVLIRLVFAGAVMETAHRVTAEGVGLLATAGFPWWVKAAATVIFMDFATFVWHFLNHEMPVLWRFHQVHHTDLNMDVSTASRFHFGELAISAAINMGVIYLIGADVWGVAIFESALVLSTQFHHSSLRIPRGFDNAWRLLFVPPSMHRIHHSVVIKERNSNYGSIFSLWDRIVGTFMAEVDQERILIGLGGARDENCLKYHHLLAMPFRKPLR